MPAALKKQALRKLWTSDPVLACLDGLNDYEDMARVYGIGPIGNTSWKIGRGFLTDEDLGILKPGEEGEPAPAEAQEEAEPLVAEAEGPPVEAEDVAEAAPGEVDVAEADADDPDAPKGA